MSKQLAVASAFSVLAMSALALFAPGAGTGSSDAASLTALAAPAVAADLGAPLALID